MLESLFVKNLALIDEAEVEFGTGLNILTGETGAGKSIVIGSINMALGAKAQKDMIRSGAEYALVELVFRLEEEEQKQKIREMDIPIEEGDRLLLQRKVSATRSVCKVCGETISQKQLQEIADLLIDIHGQHDNQFLLNKKKHMEILDAYCGRQLQEMKNSLREEYTRYEALQREYKKAHVDENQKNREISLLEYEVNEIMEASLQAGEDTALEENYQRMIHAKKLVTTIGAAHTLTSSMEEESAQSMLEHAIREMRSVTGIDSRADELMQELLEVENLLGDFSRSAAEYLETLEFSEEEYAQTEERLNLVNRLKDKYGSTIEQILAYGEQANEKLEKFRDYDRYLAQLESSIAASEKILKELCEQASQIRKEKARGLEKELAASLQGLNFLEVNFKINFEQLSHYTPEGWDEAEFMISLNPGEAVKPLIQIASGGELSRIMLGIKTILAGQDAGKTLIFDEIDAGISGKTAWQVSEKLGELSRQHQVMCITHLPQIAAMGDTHFAIVKDVSDGKTTTQIHKLNADESIEELSRLLGSDVITDAVRANAREMKENAKKSKFDITN